MASSSAASDDAVTRSGALTLWIQLPGSSVVEGMDFTGAYVYQLKKAVIAKFKLDYAPQQLRLYKLGTDSSRTQLDPTDTLSKAGIATHTKLAVELVEDSSAGSGSGAVATDRSVRAGQKRQRNDRGSGSAASASRAIPIPLSVVQNASGFALSKEGFDEPVGCMPWTGFLPAGRIRSEFLAAIRSAQATSVPWMEELGIPASLALTQPLEAVRETSIQKIWHERVEAWFPPRADATCNSINVRPTRFPVPLVLSRGCTVDYLRQLLILPPSPTSEAAAAGMVVAVTAVAELTNTLYHPKDGEPQALVAALSAAIDLLSKGLPYDQCVVPFILNTGILEQHGAAYLIGSAPCAVMTTPALDLTDAAGQRQVAAARWAFVQIAQRTEELFCSLGHTRICNAIPVKPELDPELFFWKKPLLLVGPTVQHSILHQLLVFNRLAWSASSRDIVEPVAVLMQSPPDGAALFVSPSCALVAPPKDPVASSGLNAMQLRSSRASSSPPTIASAPWSPESTVVYPRLHGFSTGVPGPDNPLRPAVLNELRVALRRFHAAGLVHMDLFSSNVMWQCVASGCASAAPDEPRSVAVRLVDLDASLFVGQPIPDGAATIIERNGHTDSFHPDVFIQAQRAKVDFDWWHFVLLSESACPFSTVGSAATELHRWLASKSNRSEVLKRVAEEVLLEESAHAAGSRF